MTWTPQSMGEKGGTKSRRTLTSEQATEMVRLREAKRGKKIISQANQEKAIVPTITPDASQQNKELLDRLRKTIFS